MQRHTGNQHIPSDIIALGIDPPEEYSAERFREKFNIKGPFVTYLGRLVSEKGVDQLLDYFVQYKETTQQDLTLVLMGKGPIEIPDRPDIITTGFVTDQEKYDGLAAAELLILPSKWESLSIIILEAWLVGTPVLVNAECSVTLAQTKRSQGGMYYRTFDEFSQMVQCMLGDKALQASLAAQGRQFVLDNYSWDTIIKKYQALFEMIESDPRGG